MARVHTDFMSLSQRDFDRLWECAQMHFDDCIVYHEVPLNYQSHLERTAERQGRIIIKRQYVL